MAHWSVKKQVDGSQVVFELCCSEYDGGAMTVRGELGRLRKNRSAVTEADRRRFWSRALDVMHGLVGEIGFEEAQRLCVRLARREPIPPAPLWSHVSPPPRRPLRAEGEAEQSRDVTLLRPPRARLTRPEPPADGGDLVGQLLKERGASRRLFENAMRSAIDSAGKARADEK